MSTHETATNLLFVRTETLWPEQSNFLIEAIGYRLNRLIEAQPIGDSVPALVSALDNQVISYDPRQGLAGVLIKARDAGLLGDQQNLLVASDQLIGPIGPIDEAFDSMNRLVRLGDSAIITLVDPDSKDDPTEAVQHSTAEPAGPLAMELTWLLIPAKVLAEDDFWSVVEKTATEAGAHAGWLNVVGLVRTLSLLGTHAMPLYEGSGDLFARDLRMYLEQEIPLLPWKLFTEDPLILERWAITPRYAFDYLGDKGYPQDLFWRRVLKACPPQTWYTNLALLDIFPDTAPDGFDNELKTAVVAHVFYPEMIEEIVSYARNVPAPVKLVVTTDTEQKRLELEAKVLNEKHFYESEVRVVTTNRGRDVSAFLLDCSDVLLDPEVDVVVKIHSKRSVQDPASVSGWFKDHLLENLLHSPGYVKHILREFQADPCLGMVMAPVIHMGLPIMGNGWTLNRGGAEQMMERLGQQVPFDDPTPLSPYGSMFFARRRALEPLVHAGFQADEFPDGVGYVDGSFAHVLERLFSYVVFGSGYYARCVQCAELAEISTTALQYKYDQVSKYLFPFASRQVRMLGADGVDALSGAQIRSLIQRQLSARHPRLGRASMAAWKQVKRLRGRAKNLLG